MPSPKNWHAGIKPVSFGREVFKKFPELIPLAAIIGVAVAGVTSFSFYSLFTKPDVQLNRRDFARWETIDVNKNQKLLHFNQEYKEDPAITALKKELSDAYKPQ